MKHSFFRFTICVRRDGERVVQNGLSLTPAQMLDLTQKGVPISARQLSIVETPPQMDNDFSVDAEFVRHADLVSSWEREQDSKHKARSILEKLRPLKRETAEGEGGNDA